MKFPEPAREGSEAHDDPVRRLAQAREDRHDRQDAPEDAKGHLSSTSRAPMLSSAGD